MGNSDNKLEQTTVLQSSLLEIEKKLSIINMKLAMQSKIVPSGAFEDDILAQEQGKLLDLQEGLLEQASRIPISRENRPEVFLNLWRRNRSNTEGYPVADMLAVKVQEYFAGT